MDRSGRHSRWNHEDWDERGRRRSEWSINVSGSANRHDASDPPESTARRRRRSVTNEQVPRQSSTLGISRHRSGHTDGRPDDRRGLAQRLQLFPHRPHSSNTSRNSSANTSSSSLLSLGDPAGEADFDQPNPYLGTSPSAHAFASTSRLPDSCHAAPLSPLSEYPPPLMSTASASSPNDYPIYPDQSYKVLQSQIYPPPHQPPSLRARNSYPSQSTTSVASSGPSFFSREYPPRIQGSRTAGSTPMSSPGLFSAQRSNSPSLGSDDGRVSYLHPTHMQEPKEYV